MGGIVSCELLMLTPPAWHHHQEGGKKKLAAARDGADSAGLKDGFVELGDKKRRRGTPTCRLRRAEHPTKTSLWSMYMAEVDQGLEPQRMARRYLGSRFCVHACTWLVVAVISNPHVAEKEI